MKKRMLLILCLLFAMVYVSTAYASELIITAAEDALEETVQFPFAAQTNELAVNIRKEASTKSAKVGRLERGTQLMVTGAEIGQSGELFYCVVLGDGTQGFIRSDLLVESETLDVRSVAPSEPEKSENQLIGNKKTKKYHEPGCRSLPAEKNRVYFESTDEAEDEGYIHCQNCD